MKDHLNTHIRIANPTAGSAGYTSPRSARKHIRRGHAVLTNEGYLYFLTRAQVVELREQEAIEANIARFRGGVIIWAGSGDPNRYRVPGEVRS